jgi:hypothetical protein
MRFQAVNKAQGIPKELRHGLPPTGAVALRVFYTELTYEFSFRNGSGGAWVRLGSIDTIEMTGLDFTGALIGVFATEGAKAGDVEVSFENLKWSKLIQESRWKGQPCIDRGIQIA